MCAKEKKYKSKNKNKKPDQIKSGNMGPMSKEEWTVRYDILNHSLWITVKFLLLLNIIWYAVFLIDDVSQWTIKLFYVMTVPVLLTVLAVFFEVCFLHFQWPLGDVTVLTILNAMTFVILAGDRWTHSLQFFCVLPIIFFMILRNVKRIYTQMVLSACMIIVHFFFIEFYAKAGWKNNIAMNLTGILFSVIVTAKVIVQIRKYTQMLDVQTTIDSLTRLHNHEAFYEELDSKLASYGAGEPLSILIADIDNFKKVNDTFGHAYGDKVLKVLASIFTEEESRKCFVSRYGGEEFAMIMDLNQSDALTKAQTIRKRFEQQMIPTDSGIENSFTVSIGVAVYQPEFKTSSQFFEKADEALYKAKAGGKNRVCI